MLKTNDINDRTDQLVNIKLTSQHKVVICFFKSHFYFKSTGNTCYVGLPTKKIHENGQKLTYEHVKFQNLDLGRPTNPYKKWCGGQKTPLSSLRRASEGEMSSNL